MKYTQEMEKGKKDKEKQQNSLRMNVFPLLRQRRVTISCALGILEFLTVNLQ